MGSSIDNLRAINCTMLMRGKKISQYDALLLSGPMEVDEIRNALFRMDVIKAP